MKYVLIILLFGCTKLPIVKTDRPVILLTFTGRDVTNPLWNKGGTFHCASASLGFKAIREILDSVTYDFQEFSVYVTVDERVYNNADSTKRVRCIITDTYQWYGSKNAGTSYTGSFSWGDDTPCFVFSSLLNHNPHFISETISHEIGHTLGLAHQAEWRDSVFVSAYSRGDGVTAPIMGDSKYARSGEWWVGRTPYYILQDDRKIIGYTLQRIYQPALRKTRRMLPNECNLLNYKL
jgi:hypothetical protein